LADIMRRTLVRRQMVEEHVGFVVDGLIETSLRGIDSHGVRLFPVYLAELDGGRSKARPELRWRGGGAMRLLDAGHALGLVAGRVAADEAVRLAREFGVGAVAVGNSNHFGAASCHTLAMARQGAVGIAMSNSDALVAPAGGRLPLFGTNPLAVAALGDDGELFCADFATSQAAYSKVKRRLERGEPLPAGWALTADGRDAGASEPGEAIAALQPLGGHKGQCLGMLVEMLCCLLAGMPLDHELAHLYAPPFDVPRQVSHLLLALDVASFADPAAFRARLAGWLALVRAQPAAGGGRVMAPGDPERETERQRRQEVPLDDDEWRSFDALAREG
jgi:ureidoglycolate dehydrogenase (NAD+)